MSFIQKIGAACFVAGLTLISSAGLATTVNYNFSGAVDSGALLGEIYAGQFAYDDAGLIGMGDAFLSVSILSFSFLGLAFDHADAVTPPEAVFFDGTFRGLNFNIDRSSLAFSVISGFADTSESYFAYDDGTGNAGFGSLDYNVHTVPEPVTWSLLLLGMFWMAARTRLR